MGVLRETSSATNLPTERMIPRVQKMGERDIEVTFLGLNAQGRPTWILWNEDEPMLIGLLTQGRLGFTFEQRTSAGVLLHENISLNLVNKALQK